MTSKTKYERMLGPCRPDMEYFAGFELSLRGSPIAFVFIVTHSNHHEINAYLYKFSFVFDNRQMAMLAIGLQQDALSEHSCFLNQHLRNIRCDTYDINLVCLANPLRGKDSILPAFSPPKLGRFCCTEIIRPRIAGTFGTAKTD